MYNILSCCLCLLPALSFAQQQIPLLPGPPPSNWHTAGLDPLSSLEISQFQQREPQDAAPSTYSTHAQIARDSKYIYLFLRAEAPASSIRANLNPRDKLSGDDCIGLYLDTFHDRRRAYIFFVNPLGVQMDGIAAEDQDDDYSFDTIWQSGGRLTATGYEVWMRIPLQSIRYASGEAASWGIAITRYHAATSEIDTWPYISRANQGFVPHFLDTIAPSSKPAKASYRFIPYLSSQRAGGDLQVNMEGRLSLDFTFNPDFSHVESDSPQPTRNARFENFYPERRAFFLEHSDLFQTPEAAFFTRRIVDPKLGARLTSSTENWKFALLSAKDEENSTATVARIRRDFGTRGSIGTLLTNRDENTLTAIDATWRFTNHLTTTNQVLNDNGLASFSELRYQTRNLHAFSAYRYRAPTFDAALGYMPRVDLSQFSNSAGYRLRPKHSLLLAWGPDLTYTRTGNSRNQLTDWSVSAPLWFVFRNQRELILTHTKRFEAYGPVRLRTHRHSIYFSDESNRLVHYSASYAKGGEINYYPTPTPGQATSFTASLTLKPNPRTRIDSYFISNEIKNLYSEQLWRIKVSRQFTKSLGLRAIHDQHNKDLLLRYQTSPLTALYIGYTQHSYPIRDHLFYAKISYLITH